MTTDFDIDSFEEYKQKLLEKVPSIEQKHIDYMCFHDVFISSRGRSNLDEEQIPNNKKGYIIADFEKENWDLASVYEEQIIKHETDDDYLTDINGSSEQLIQEMKKMENYHFVENKAEAMSRII